MTTFEVENVDFNNKGIYLDFENVSQFPLGISKSSKQLYSMDLSESEENGFNKSSIKNHIVSLVTAFYVVILVIYAVVLELSSWLLQMNVKRGVERADSFVFYLYIYIVSFIYFVYCYVIFCKKLCLRSPNDNPKLHPVGTLYIRLGAVVFAIVASVYFGFSAYSGTSVILDICAIVFTVVQTHLLFYSSTMLDDNHFVISCFGTMHLVAANLITWFQFLFVKNRSTHKTILKNSNKNKTIKYLSLMTTPMSIFNSDEEMDDKFSDAVKKMEMTENFIYVESQWVEGTFGSFTKVFYTAVVEYSLIAAAIMFIVWHNIGKDHKNITSHQNQKKGANRKRWLTDLCYKNFTWLKQIYGFGIGGVLFFGTIVSMVFFYINCKEDEHYTAARIFNFTDVVHNVIGTVTCVFAFWRIRSLKFVDHESDEFHANQELLDMILLAIGLIGELAFSIAGLTGIYSVHQWHSLSVVLTASHIIQIIQSVFQCFVICFASKMRSKDSTEQPGKQSITFLIILNISMFIYYLFISDKAGTYESIINFYGDQNWVFLVRIFSPLTIFFRFHSSVCFFEIWQHTYSVEH